MKGSIKLLIAIGLLALILSSGYIMELINGGSENTDPIGQYNERYQEIEAKIDTLSSGYWDKSAYKKIRRVITSSSSNQLVNEEESYEIAEES